MLRRACLILALLLVGACGRPGSEAPAPPSDAPPAVPPGPPARGELRSDAGGLRFRTCGAPESASLPLTGKAAEIEDAWNAFSVPRGSGLYLELRGTPEPTGFRVEELVRARPLGEGGSCEQPVFDGDFVIHGNEPFWSIEIRRDAIVYRDPDELQGRKYPYAATRAAGELFYATRLEGPKPSALEIALESRRCVDSMSGEIRSHEARVTLDGRELRGCAAAGVPFGEFGDGPLDELERYAGTSEAQGTLWSREPLGARLKALLGGELPAFEERFGVSGPLRKEGGIYFATGNQAHRGGLDVAAFWADPQSDTINVAIVKDRKREDFKEGGRDVAIPAEVETFLRNLE